MNWHRGLLTIGVTVVATAVTTGLAAAPGSAVKTAQPSARAWVTTPDGQYRMSNLGAVPFHTGGSKLIRQWICVPHEKIPAPVIPKQMTGIQARTPKKEGHHDRSN